VLRLDSSGSLVRRPRARRRDAALRCRNQLAVSGTIAPGSLRHNSGGTLEREPAPTTGLSSTQSAADRGLA